ncbi:MAG: hypothetical protein IJ833_01710 [Lachnospiraceae bacterium]|nr:hypothetical protein [Lachnospiraceae bacterium]
MNKSRESKRAAWRWKWKEEYTDALLFAIIWLGFSVVTLMLFYRQAGAGADKMYESDMKAYMLEMQGLDSGYSFPYPVFFKLSALIHLFVSPEWAVSLATMLLNSFGVLLMKLQLNRMFVTAWEQRAGGKKWLVGLGLSLLAVSLFLISMVYPPYRITLPGIRHRYTGVFTANPFHNATYMAARPFAILSFFQFGKLLDEYEKGYSGSWKESERGVALRDYVLFALYLLLATMTKPSFTTVLVGAAGLLMVYRMVKNKFRTFVPTVQLGVCFIPTFLDLLYQYKGVFVPTGEEAERGIGFGVGKVWAHYCDNIPLAICLAIGFPLLVLLLNYKEWMKNTLYRFSWQIYLCGFAYALLLYEKGFRKVDFNFSWGYMYGIFFAFVGALLVLLKATVKKEKPLLLTLQWLAYLAHLVCGLLYFVHIFQGGAYY